MKKKTDNRDMKRYYENDLISFRTGNSYRYGTILKIETDDEGNKIYVVICSELIYRIKEEDIMRDYGVDQ